MNRVASLVALVVSLSGCNEGSFAGASGKQTNPPKAATAPTGTGTSPGSGNALPAGSKPGSGKTTGSKPTNSTANAIGKPGTATPILTNSGDSGSQNPTTDAGAGAATVTANPPQDNVLAPVDSSCGNGAGGPTGILGALLGSHDIAPPQSPLPQTVPAGCRTGFEINNYHGTFDLGASSPQGTTADLQLEVDIATYQAPDAIRILATNASGQQQVILDTCRLSTSNYPDPTDGQSRPPEDSIRYYRPTMPAGTTRLTVDFTGSATPQYLRVIGTCQLGGPSGGAPGSYRSASN